jgi:hypothetical protein
MSNIQPTQEQWRRLYDLMPRVKELAPWEWMEELDIFGVQDPESGEFGFVSIMGQLGEHFAVAVYLGEEGLSKLWDLHDLGPDMTPQDVLETPQLQASWEDREQLTDRDRAVMKELGLKFRGRNAWPQFRSYRPGYFPWYIEAHEARFLTVALEQLLNVAPRFKDNRDLLDPNPDEPLYLVRVPSKVDGALEWHDQIIEVTAPEPAELDVKIHPGSLEHLKTLPVRDETVEIDLFMLESPVQERGERPQFPYGLMLVHSSSGQIIGFEMLRAEPALEDMWSEVPLHVGIQLARVDLRPRIITVENHLVGALLQPLARELGLEIRLAPYLRALEYAKSSLMGFMGGRFR